MAIWFLRLSAAICLTMTVGGLGLVGQQWYQSSAEQAAIEVAKRHVRKLGGFFSFSVEGRDYVISLHGSNISDVEIEQLVVVLQPLEKCSSQSREVQRLFGFDLAGTRVGNRGIQAINTLPLSWLNLNDTHITDRALAHLRNQDSLSVMTVARTKVTKPAIQEIQAALPQLWIPQIGPAF